MPDEFLPNVGDLEATGKLLQTSATELIGLSLLGKQLAYNVYGADSYDVREAINDWQRHWHKAGHKLAKRSAVLGYPVNVQASAIASAVKDVDAVPIEDDDALEEVSGRLKAESDALRSRLGQLDDDLPTQYLLLSIICRLEKQLWKVRTWLQDDSDEDGEDGDTEVDAEQDDSEASAEEPPAEERDEEELTRSAPPMSTRPWKL